MERISLLKSPARIRGRVEISRSFTFKLNVGNYESRDFFAAQRAECAAEDMDEISEALYQFCKKCVLRSVADWEESAAAQFAPSKARRSA